ncbi:aldehyde dehydrogenase (NADP(+)) [Desertivirga arenae]|uniref:aldehyde dehydrogenase (NADP(+)) n=1 Tax=Desertivirga arenae TaxID=2810309 RepID=UPI001A9779AA|nr:aldehyde dehydrogenase (NADP(+)) [Pedobacter sp. SYSU D00823]
MNTKNIIALRYVESVDSPFRAVNPFTGLELDGEFYQADSNQINAAFDSANAAFSVFRSIGKSKKAAFLRAVGEEILALGDDLIKRAGEESGLPVARLQGERGRTIAQLNMFADQVEEGSWVEAIIDSALPDRQPVARVDLRRMLVPIGPVVVFGSSNFPLAFSVAGGDTASAFAAGCPVIVKAHPAHPGTSALVGAAIVKAAEKTEMPAGIFSLVYGGGHEIGGMLVKHPVAKAVAFTGSFNGGIALSKLAAQRTQPIPVFAEMSSINPVILLPEALEERAEQIAEEYAASITLGVGQFCTNPGLLIGIESPALERFKAALQKAVTDSESSTMLTEGICRNYHSLLGKMLEQEGVKLLSKSDKLNQSARNQALATVAEISSGEFLQNRELREEVFGPWSLLVTVKETSEIETVLDSVGGQLTVSIMTGSGGTHNYSSILDKASEIAGRVLMNGVPTGVEVCHAMQHGGPFPSTTDSRFTSVGATAIRRFVRPVCWQSWEHDLLPEELQDGNPLNIWRLKNKLWTKD